MISRLSARPADTGSGVAAPAASDIPSRLGPFALRPAHPDTDRSLLLAAYASSRHDDPDLLGRHPDSRHAVIEHEFESRQASYPVDFPGVEFFLLDLDDRPAGRLYVQSTPTEVFIVDLVLLGCFRGHGHGTALLHDAIRHAHDGGRPVRLHVAKSNPRAAALYQRLGFRLAEELTAHDLLEKLPEG